jgi:hypothetical protein
MIRSIFYKLIKRKEVLEGGRIKLGDFRGLPFNNRVHNLIRMFELRDWFIQNTPNYRVATKYTAQMAELHHELNYQTARIALKRIVLFLTAVVLWKMMTPEHNPDWADRFDAKFQLKTYGSLEEGASEGGSDED